MLAIQENFVRWEKNSRTPQGAAERKSCFLPHKIDESVNLNGDGIFVCQNIYYQYDTICTPEEIRRKYSRTNARWWDSEDTYLISQANSAIYWGGNPKLPVHDEREHFLLKLDKLQAQRKGMFYKTLSETDVSGIDIIDENGKYTVKWLSSEYSGFKPIRSVYNEDYNRKGAKAQGKRIMCETAFILDKGESGRIDFNYRCAGEYGQHYRQYSIYFINTDKLEYDSFLNEKYGYKYSQMADLF
ncbi:MAG: hypothetical protein IJR45_08135 [Firmicutes bacterium]|nr:hypothetical protein [Bacillota bacterium]